MVAGRNHSSYFGLFNHTKRITVEDVKIYEYELLNCRSSALDSKPFTGELKRGPGVATVCWKMFFQQQEEEKRSRDPAEMSVLNDLKLNVFHLTFPATCRPSKSLKSLTPCSRLCRHE